MQIGCVEFLQRKALRMSNTQNTNPFSFTPEAIVKAGVAAALMAVASWVTVTFGPVPFTLQTMALTFVICALDGRTSALALVVYVLLGAIGVPVFSGMRGGVGVLFGATGGYILGFVVVAFVVGYLRSVMAAGLKRDIISAVLALVIVHAFGVVWLGTVGAMGIPAAFAAGSLPFLIFDALKGAAGVLLAQVVVRAVPQIAA